jgi:hypothetical protein
MRVFAGVDIKVLIKEKRLKENKEADDSMPCPVETLEHIVSERKNYLSSSRS